MNKFTIETIVDGNYKDVYKQFDRKLFEFLLPPFLKLKRFDGSRVDDEVHLNGLGIINWVSIITKEYESDDECYFIDVGKDLPFPLTNWKHIHKVQKIDKDKSKIIDEISFESYSKLINPILKPTLVFLFKQRGPQYKEFFKKTS